MTISVYTDGSSSGKSSLPGGWGYVILRGEEVVCCNRGGSPTTTNNEMELKAALEGLKEVRRRKLHEGNVVELVSDSKVTLGLASGAFRPSKYHKMVEALRLVVIDTGARLKWVKGHSKHPWNERVDRLAKMGKADYLIEGYVNYCKICRLQFENRAAYENHYRLHDS